MLVTGQSAVPKDLFGRDSPPSLFKYVGAPVRSAAVLDAFPEQSSRAQAFIARAEGTSDCRQSCG